MNSHNHIILLDKLDCLFGLCLFYTLIIEISTDEIEVEINVQNNITKYVLCILVCWFLTGYFQSIMSYDKDTFKKNTVSI